MKGSESVLGKAYRRIYEGLCGRHPDVRPWHFQWLDTYYLNRGLLDVLPDLRGVVLDAGCGDKPYRDWFRQVTVYIGLDVAPGANVDVVIASDQPWPFEAEYFDVILSSQVLEHVEHLELTLSEMRRVLRKGGQMVLSFPFLYNEHGAPQDFRRFTIHQVRMFFADYEIVSLKRLGGIGSTLTILLLNWIEQCLNRMFVTRCLKALLLPLWMLFSLTMNLVGLMLDRLDKTDAFYNNLLIVVRKVQESSN